MKIDLFVVSGRTLDTDPCVLLLCENSYYVFNFPDLTQRIFMEYKWKMLKIKQIFLTDTSSSSIGVIPGMILTTLNNQKPPFGFIGPDNISTILQKQALYQNLPDLFPEIQSGIYEDKFLCVTPIQLHSTRAYSIKLCDEPGKFDLQKAKKLGLKPGPLFKKLTGGESITLDDGRIIEPSMCVENPIPGSTILILDIKENEDIDILLQKDITLAHYDIIVHYTQPIILHSERYQSIFTDSYLQYTTRTNKNQIQIIFEDFPNVTFRESYNIFSNITSKRLLMSDVNNQIDASKQSDMFIQGEIGLNYSIVPSSKRKITSTQPFNDKMYRSLPFDFELLQIESFGLTFLGTGCNMPTKLRNVAGILLHLKDGYIVLDAGEGFTGQLFRRFGRQNGEKIISKLIAVWTSHSHGDHVFGLHQLLEYHKKVTDQRIPIFADQIIIEDLITRGDFNVDYHNREIKFYHNNHIELQQFPVEHIEDSHGCTIMIDNKYKVAYSGDHSVAKDNFIEQVGQCDLLIHEASFSDDLEKEALERNHSTINQAIEAGKRLHSKFTVLTHFSARYKLDNCIMSNENVLFAFDYLSFNFEDCLRTCEKCRNGFLHILNANLAE